jgi:hypothetical protein
MTLLVVGPRRRKNLLNKSMLFRCKVHKVVLHTLLACVNDVRRLKSDPGFTDDILNFNEVYAEGNTANTSQKISNYSEAFQVWISFS